jgi:hypothetical protein
VKSTQCPTGAHGSVVKQLHDSLVMHDAGGTLHASKGAHTGGTHPGFGPWHPEIRFQPSGHGPASGIAMQSPSSPR